MRQPIKKVTIKRSRWSSPGPVFANKLYTVNGKKMCCLGFCAREAGLTVAQIKGRPDPNHLEADDLDKFEKAFPGFFQDGVLADLMEINDNETMPRAQREQRLKELASKAGVLFEFVD